MADYSGPFSGTTTDGTDASDNFRIDATNSATINGLGGNDLFDLYASGASSYLSVRLNGGDGNDRIKFAEGSSFTGSVDGGSGTDIVEANYSTALSMVVENGLTVIKAQNSSIELANVERLVLKGSNSADSFVGLSGNDWLDGRGGVDHFRGSAGDDGYVFDSVGEFVAGEDAGIDTIWSTVSVDLNRSAGVENLRLQGGDINGTGNALANTITGSAGNNAIAGGLGNDQLWGKDGNDTLSGGDGNDVLYGGNDNDNLIGGAGADSMYGGAGADSYNVSDAGDVVSEVVGQSVDDGAVDTVWSSVTFKLGSHLENLRLAGSSAIDATGNELANLITGTASANVITGGAGIDQLWGKGGNDTFAFAEMGALNRDTIFDFNDGDRIQLSKAVFTGLDANSDGFVDALSLSGKAEGGAYAQLIYDNKTGILSYDADGTGIGTAQDIAIIGGNLAGTLGTDDFLLVA